MATYIATALGNAGKRVGKTDIAKLLEGLTVTEHVPLPGGLQIDVLGKAPAAKASAKAPKVVATGRATATKSGPLTVKVRPTKAGKKALKKAKRMKVYLQMTCTPKGFPKTVSKAKALTIKRKKK